MNQRLACHIGFLLFFLTAFRLQALAQHTDRCGTMQVLSRKLSTNKAVKSRFLELELEFNKILADRQETENQQTETAPIIIPVVFHIVLRNPDVIRDADILNQLDILNARFAGLHPDSLLIPAHFKPLSGKSQIRFCLAKRTPTRDATNGIVRYTTSVDSFYIVNDNIKYRAAGGADAWDTRSYMNIWVCEIGNGITGFSTLPGEGNPDEQGVVINAQTLPGGASPRFNQGKTLVHETGHYLNLRHIWGDDNGGCTGSDFVDDTPNQAGSSSGVLTGIKTDNCTPAFPGIMYQNYMDYTDDESLLMFTSQQVARMETSVPFYRSSLLNSQGCQPLVQHVTDAELTNLSVPDKRLCASPFIPAVRLRNLGTGILNSVGLHIQVDQSPVISTTWSGSLASLQSTEVRFSSLMLPFGEHTVTIFTDAPNNSVDNDKVNDTLRFTFSYQQPLQLPLQERFETQFPPSGWQVLNPDRSFTWERITVASKTGVASIMVKNFSYAELGERDYLEMPGLSLPDADSVFLTFHVAAAVYHSLQTPGRIFDSLKVLVSTDCGLTYKTVYQKSGASLITRPEPVEEDFIPLAGDWRKDSINLHEFAGKDNVLIRFENVNAFGNNIYVDDVEVYNKPMNEQLREKGFLISPNPVSSLLSVKLFPPPQDLRVIQLFTMSGQKVKEVKANGLAHTYLVDMRDLPPGLYVVQLVLAGKTITQKVLKN